MRKIILSGKTNKNVICSTSVNFLSPPPRIDANVEDTQLNVEAAHTEILKYFQSVSSNRWLMIKIFLVLVVFFIVFVVFFAWREVRRSGEGEYKKRWTETTNPQNKIEGPKSSLKWLFNGGSRDSEDFSVQATDSWS